MIYRSVAATGAACYVGEGLNTYSHVHIDDVTRLFTLALAKGPRERSTTPRPARPPTAGSRNASPTTWDAAPEASTKRKRPTSGASSTP